MSTVHDAADRLAELTGPGGRFEIITEPVRGVPLRIYRHAPHTLRDVFAGSHAHGDRTAIVYGDERWSFADQFVTVARLAEALRRELGVSPGDRVAIAMRNYPEWILAFWAATVVGAIVVPLNAWWQQDELVDALTTTTPVVLFGDAPRLQAIAARRSELPALRTTIEVRPDSVLVGDRTFADVLAAVPEDMPLPDVAIDADDDATVIFTSGTTGRAKGAVATHRGHVHASWNLHVWGAQHAGPAPVAPPDADATAPAGLVTYPFFHVAGLGLIKLAAETGSTLVLMYRWDPLLAADLIVRERISSVAGVPAVLEGLLDVLDASDRDVSSLRTMRTGGAQASTRLIDRIERTFEGRVGTGTGYGMTETSGAMVMIGHELVRHPQAVGRPLPVTELRIVDEGRDVSPGNVGEAWLRGPTVTRGYWNAESDAHLPDGWFRTGDLVRIDEHGLLRVVDRLKDIVIRGGENVPCPEVEDVLMSHDDVAAAAVIGIPHDTLGEEVGAVVQLRPGSELDVEAIRSHVAARLAAFKVPSRVLLQTEELPRNASGKILKRELRRTVLERLAGDSADHDAS